MSRAKIVILIIALALLGMVLLYFKFDQRLVSEQAEVSLATEAVSAQITGYVTEVSAQNGQAVAAGDVLVKLDPADYEVALSDARAVLAAMERGTPQAVAQGLYAARAGQPDAAELEARVAAARQEELAARSAMEDLSTQAARATLERRRAESAGDGSLAARKNQEEIIAAQLGLAREKLTVASEFRAQLERDLEQQKNILRQLDSQTVISEVLPAQLEAQAARVRQAEVNLANTEILAPVDGRVIMRVVDAGQVVSPGQPLMAIIPDPKDRFYVTALFPVELDGKFLGEVIKPGQYCEVSLTDMDGVEFTGWVEDVALPQGAPFALPQQEGAAGAGAKPQISVRVVVENYDPRTMPALQPGMPAEVRLDPGRQAAPEPAPAPTANKTAS